MKKKTTPKLRSLTLARETIRALATQRLVEVGGAQRPLRTITCDDECDSYACNATLC